MFGKKHCYLGRLALLLVALLFSGGCASLKPSASETPPDFEGGMKISDGSRGALGICGTCLYFLGPFLSGY
jgi:hypothetical protein